MQPYDIYELMITPPNKKADLIVKELMEDNPNLNLVSDLITLGANLDWQGDSNYSWPVLHMFVIYNHLQLVKMLIDSGGDLNIQDEYERTALHVCANWNHPEIARMLIDAGADVNAQDERGETALYRCAWKNHLDIARILIEAGGDKTIRDDRGKLPYDIAETKELQELLKV